MLAFHLIARRLGDATSDAILQRHIAMLCEAKLAPDRAFHRQRILYCKKKQRETVVKLHYCLDFRQEIEYNILSVKYQSVSRISSRVIEGTTTMSRPAGSP